MNTYDIYLVKSGLVGIYGEWQWLNLRAFDDYSEACKFAKMVEKQIKPELLGEIEDVTIETVTVERLS